MVAVRDLGQNRGLWVGQGTLGQCGIPGWEGAGGRGHGAMVQAGRTVEQCRVRKGDGLLLMEHGAMVRARLIERATGQAAKMGKRFRQKGWKQVVGRRMEPCRRQEDAGMLREAEMEPHIGQG